MRMHMYEHSCTANSGSRHTRALYASACTHARGCARQMRKASAWVHCLCLIVFSHLRYMRTHTHTHTRRCVHAARVTGGTHNTRHTLYTAHTLRGTHAGACMRHAPHAACTSSTHTCRCMLAGVFKACGISAEICQQLGAVNTYRRCA